MAEQSQDRTLPASGRKIARARGEGQVARSKDLSHLAALGVGASVLMAIAPMAGGWLTDRLATALRFGSAELAHERQMLDLLVTGGGVLLIAALPFGALMLAMALLAGVLSGGWNFTLKPLKPRFEKLDPIQGLKRMVSLPQMGPLLKACLLALALAVVGGLYVQARLPAMAQLIAMPLPSALGTAGQVIWSGFALLLLTLALFALVDVPLQRQLLLRQLRMSHAEVKNEHKEIEGNPEVKGKIKQRMREMARRRMLAAVPRADLVVMNPTHYAVALKYDDRAMAAPRVVAKGLDRLALRIRDLAQEHDVPVLEAPPLARALYAHTEVDQEIPAALFSAVAQVLAWVYQLRAAVAAGRPFLTPLPALAVPAELDPAQRAGAQPGALA